MSKNYDKAYIIRQQEAANNEISSSSGVVPFSFGGIGTVLSQRGRTTPYIGSIGQDFTSRDNFASFITQSTPVEAPIIDSSSYVALGAYAAYSAPGGSVSGSHLSSFGDGTKVTKILDLSGNGRHLTQSNSDKAPLWMSSGTNGRGGVLFNSGDGEKYWVSEDPFDFTDTDYVVVHIFRQSSKQYEGYVRYGLDSGSANAEFELYQTEGGGINRFYGVQNRDTGVNYSQWENQKTFVQYNRVGIDEWKTNIIALKHHIPTTNLEGKLDVFGSQFDPPTQWNDNDSEMGVTETYQPDRVISDTANFYIGISQADGTSADWAYDGEWLATLVYTASADYNKSDVHSLATSSIVAQDYYYESGLSAASNMIAYWPMNKMSSSASDRYHADIVNGYLLDQEGADYDLYQGAESFVYNSPTGWQVWNSDYSDLTDYLTASNADGRYSPGSGSFSVFTWTYAPQFNATYDFCPLLLTRIPGGDGWNLSYYYTGGEYRFIVQADDGSNYTYCYINSSNADNGFGEIIEGSLRTEGCVHLAGFVIDRNEDLLKLYYDAVLVATASLSSFGSINDTNPLRFAHDNSHCARTVTFGPTFIRGDVFTENELEDMWRAGRGDYYTNYVSASSGISYFFEFHDTGSFNINGSSDSFSYVASPTEVVERVSGLITGSVSGVTGSHYALPWGHIRGWKCTGSASPSIEIDNGTGNFDFMHNTTTFTYAAWFKIINTGDSSQKTTLFSTIQSGSSVFSTGGTHLMLNNETKTNKLEARIDYGLEGSSLAYYSWETGNNAINDTDWHHVVFTIDASDGTGSAGQIYVDGVAQSISRQTEGGIFSIDKSSTIRANLCESGGDDYTNVIYGSVGIWNRQLSADEVRVLYYGGLGTRGGTSTDVSQIP